MNRASATVTPPSQNDLLQIDRRLVLHLSRSIMAPKCISKHTRLQSPNSLDHSLQVYLQSLSIMASLCISTLSQSPLSIASPNPLDRGLQCISKLAQSRSPSASSNLLNHGLGIYHCLPMIIISRRNMKQGKIECVFRIMRCLCTPGSPKSIFTASMSISIIPISLNVYIYRDLDNPSRITM
jgi:hypothetical protein